MNDLVHNLLANPVQPFISSDQFGHFEVTPSFCLVASGESKNRLGSNSKCPNWAIALKG